jgi:hypothetical protein
VSPEFIAAEAAVLDTCTVINLAVMPCGGQLLAELPHAFHVPEQVIYEAIGHRRPQQDCRKALLEHLLECRLELPREYELFGDLVSREGRKALGDGEAAVIALGHVRGLFVVTDDGPAMDVLSSEIPVDNCTSLGLVRAGLTLGVLCEADAGAAIVAALTDARMAIHDRDRRTVQKYLKLKTVDRFKTCHASEQ